MRNIWNRYNCSLLNVSLCQIVIDHQIFEGLCYILHFSNFSSFIVSQSLFGWPCVWLIHYQPSDCTFKNLVKHSKTQKVGYDKTTAFRLNDWECKDSKKTQFSYMQRCFALSGNEQNKGSVILLVIHSHLLTNLALSDLKERKKNIDEKLNYLILVHTIS